MDEGTFTIQDNKIIYRFHNHLCENTDEVMESVLFREIVRCAVAKLQKRRSVLLKVFGKDNIGDHDLEALIQTLKSLSKMEGKQVSGVVKGSAVFFKDSVLFNDFVEYLYNYWRGFDRFAICDATGSDFDKRPFRTFNATVGQLTGMIRGLYRDIQENITGYHPRIYRQVVAGVEVSTISIAKEIPFKNSLYRKLNAIPIIRQILLHPPLILNPPMNKRTGKFEKIDQNPFTLFDFKEGEWLCYPAKVGTLLILIYFHNKFSELGHSLCNLFQLAEDEDLQRQPDAVYAFGVPGTCLDNLGVFPTVFYEDQSCDLLVAAVPGDDKFGYFGYLKKMVLTLHNIIMMKRGVLPFHGALVRLILKGDRDRTILFIGDTGAGKSETLEALRELGEEEIQDLIIIADDMGSLQIGRDGKIIGYGTETGAFLRLDDLQPGYALGQIDRAIIMSANQVNARIIIPVTTYDRVISGQKIDFILYANNYDGVDEDHPIVEKFDSAEHAISVFREGTVMSKGTTTSTGLVHSYFANIFGPPQYKDIHEKLAQKYFDAFFKAGVFVGQIRTRLGLAGWERNGPKTAAEELLKILK